MSVKLYSWNPRRPVVPGRLGKILPLRQRVNNFGDLLGPVIVRKILATRGVEERDKSINTTLMSVGSVMHFSPPGATVWGTGINGKVPPAPGDLQDLDIRAVRGPRTREKLAELGLDAPAVYGDPALLYSHLWPVRQTHEDQSKDRPVFIPNLNDERDGVSVPDGIRVVSPTENLNTIVRTIANAELVMGSSLHAIVLAESMGVPARYVVSAHESPFKYEDYYSGTGRNHYGPAGTVRSALGMGGERRPVWESSALMAAFPWDLWGNPSVKPVAPVWGQSANKFDRLK